MKILTYHINLDERGSFYADVRRGDKTIYEIKAGDELGEGESSIFEDGFMKDKYDTEGLTDYLFEMGAIKKDEKVLFLA